MQGRAMLREVLTFLTGIVGTLMSFGHFSQAYRIFQRKSSLDVSMLTYIVFFFGSVIWVLYGLVIREMAIVVSFGVGVIGTATVLGLAMRYRKPQKGRRIPEKR